MQDYKYYIITLIFKYSINPSVSLCFKNNFIISKKLFQFIKTCSYQLPTLCKKTLLPKIN